MVEFGNSLDPDKEFDDLLHGILEFSVDDCLEEGEIAEDWDIGDTQCLGPIPFDILMELPMISNEQLDFASTAGAPEQKQLPKQRKLARVQESGPFHTESPVSVLESSESDSSIPARSSSKQLRDLSINPELSTSSQTSNARRRKESRKLPVALDLMRNYPRNVDSSLNVSDPAYQIASKPRPPLVKKCAHCQSSKTAQWRDGPLGSSTLCNACGLRYRSGRLFPEYRPLSSPTFVPSQHSNSHRKVAKMRNEAKRLKVEIKIDGAPEQTQLPVHNTSRHFSLLESSHSYLKYRSEYINHAGTKPCVPPSPPYEKTLDEGTSFEMHLENDDKSLDGSDCALLLNGSNPCSPLAKKKKKKKKCAHCESPKTPYWREGPCSACGKQYRAGRQVPEYRPKASPTFVSSQHSNNHRSTTEMMQSTAGTKIDGAPEQNQVEKMHVDTSSHVSLLGDNCSYLKYGSKHVKHTCAKPCVSHPSPCEKTSCEEKLFEVPIEYANDKSDSALLQNASDPWPAVIKKCTHCQTTKTRRWREGPLGPHTLCTACGMRYRSGRLLPEYRPRQRSNSQTMLVKMMQPNADIKKRCCAHCQSTMTTKWRMGPLGRHTLCNAYGQQYQAGSLVPEYRPKASLGFVPSQHSNNRRNNLKRMQSTAGIEKKRCAHCESTKTPAWLKGPLGPGTLCNACGKRYRAGRLFPEYRPEGSPTFVPGQHSNFHTRVVKIHEDEN